MKQKLRIIITTGVMLGIFSIISIMALESNQLVNAPDGNTETITTETANVTPEPVEFRKNLFPDNRIVALYGSPDTPVLGVLGEQSPEEAATRVKQLADEHQAHSQEKIIPAFEIITTIASASPTSNNDYSRELDINKLKPWVEVAKQNDIYVVLDLQPGLTDFLTQAKLYEELLKEPHVGLALDPEWRLKPGQKHMKQIGSVSASEVNATAAWLDKLTSDNDLPQKLFLLHQFRLSMIEGRHTLNTGLDNLAWLVHMDGLGAQNVKQETWRTIQRDLPSGTYLGWKNFIDEDKPMLTPEQTMSTIQPIPYYISYQ